MSQGCHDFLWVFVQGLEPAQVADRCFVSANLLCIFSDSLFISGVSRIFQIYELVGFIQGVGQEKIKLSTWVDVRYEVSLPHQIAIARATVSSSTTANRPLRIGVATRPAQREATTDIDWQRRRISRCTTTYASMCHVEFNYSYVQEDPLNNNASIKRILFDAASRQGRLYAQWRQTNNNNYRSSTVHNQNMNKGEANYSKSQWHVAKRWTKWILFEVPYGAVKHGTTKYAAGVQLTCFTLTASMGGVRPDRSAANYTKSCALAFDTPGKYVPRRHTTFHIRTLAGLCSQEKLLQLTSYKLHEKPKITP